MNFLLANIAKPPTYHSHSIPYEVNSKVIYAFFVFTITYLIIVYLFARLGTKRKIGFINSFIVCFFFTPVIGYFIVINSQHRRKGQSRGASRKLYKCNHCGYKFFEPFDVCPICGREKRQSDLNQEKNSDSV